MSTLHCSSCQQDLPVDAFHPAKNKRGRSYYCISCNKEQARVRYEANLKFIHDLKTSQGCAICGYNEHPAALQFDHLDPDDKFEKSKGQGAIQHTWSKQRILDEVAKCRVLCANCHSVVSFEEGHLGKSFHKKNRSH